MFVTDSRSRARPQTQEWLTSFAEKVWMSLCMLHLLPEHLSFKFISSESIQLRFSQFPSQHWYSDGKWVDSLTAWSTLWVDKISRVFNVMELDGRSKWMLKSPMIISFLRRTRRLQCSRKARKLIEKNWISQLVFYSAVVFTDRKSEHAVVQWEWLERV